MPCAPELTEAGWNTLFDFTAEFGGLDYSRELARRYADQALEALAHFDDSPTKNTLAAVVDYVVHRRR
ncbi:MAG: hypothetical protein FD129_1609 [bacterium]|nr:MAG: hypothetical protein FD129_1609 [bacterium]